MKKIGLLLVCAALGFAACNGSDRTEPAVQDSVRKNPADSFYYNPATPAAQNSDDPDRFSQ